MPALNVALSADQLASRMQDRLRGAGAAQAKTMLWQQQNNRALIYLDSLHTQLLDGWLLCDLDLQADETGRQTLQFVFYLGTTGHGDGLSASAKINASTAQAAQLAEVWGTTVQRLLWDAVLDALEAFVEQAAVKYPGQPLAIQGFQSTPKGLTAVLLAGDK